MPNYHATVDGQIQFTAQEEIDWTAEQSSYNNGASDRAKIAHNNLIDTQIESLETKQHRAVREALIGVVGAVARVAAIDVSISALRGQRQ